MRTTNKPFVHILHSATLAGLLFAAIVSPSSASDFAGSLKGISIIDAQGNNKPPVALFIYTRNDNSFTFDASGASDPDGNIATYKWDFGDGNTGTGLTTNHQYSKSGNYQVTLTVIDNIGGASLTQQTISYGSNIYWSMDTLPDTFMTSESGNVIITKYMNAAQSVAGVKGNAMQQTSTNQAYTIPIAAIPATKGSITMHVKHDFGTDSNNRFFFKTTETGKANTIYAYVYKSTIYFYIYDETGSYRRAYAALPIDVNVWYKYEFSWDASTGYLGIKRDGNILSEQKGVAWPPCTWGEPDKLFIGFYWPIGSFDEFSISN